MDGAGQTPTARIVAEARAPLTVVDADGRKIEFRRPGALDRLRLFKALGPALSANNLYVGYAPTQLPPQKSDIPWLEHPSCVQPPCCASQM